MEAVQDGTKMSSLEAFLPFQPTSVTLCQFALLAAVPVAATNDVHVGVVRLLAAAVEAEETVTLAPQHFVQPDYSVLWNDLIRSPADNHELFLQTFQHHSLTLIIKPDSYSITKLH